MKTLITTILVVVASLGAAAQTGTADPSDLASKLYEAVSQNRPDLLNNYMPDYKAMATLKPSTDDSLKTVSQLGLTYYGLQQQVTKAYTTFTGQGVEFALKGNTGLYGMSSSIETVKYTLNGVNKAIVKYIFEINGKKYTISAQAAELNGRWYILGNILPQSQNIETMK